MATHQGKLEHPELTPPPGAMRSEGRRRGGSLLRSPTLASRRVADHPRAFLLASVLAAVLLNLWVTRGQTFFSDEWGRLLLFGDSFDSLLRGYSGHLVVLHAALYKAMFALFGADSYLPFRLVEAALVGACGLLFYALARSRAGRWPCVAATLVLLFLGSAVEVTATPYGIVILLPMAFGLAALVTLVRLPRSWDPLACLLLIASVASQSLGLAFVVGAAVVLWLQSGRAVLRRSWVVLVPTVLYASWYAWSRLTSGPGLSDNPVQLHNVAEVPSTIVSVGSAGLSAATGLFGTSDLGGLTQFNLSAGYVVLGLLVIAAAWRVTSGSPPAREIWIPIAVALAFWALVGMVSSPERPPEASRYLYPSAAFVLLIVLELARGIRATPAVVIASCGALVVSLVPNVVNLVDQGRALRNVAARERAELGAVELLGRETPASSLPPVAIQAGALKVGAQTSFSLASGYLAAVDRYGSPALSPTGLAAAGEEDRLAADRVLADAGDLAVTRLGPGSRSRAGECRPALGRPFPVPPRGVVVQPRGSASVTLQARRFADAYDRLQAPAGAGPLLVRPPASEEGRPWVVVVHGATVCVTP